MSSKDKTLIQIIAPVAPRRKFGGGIDTHVFEIVKHLFSKFDFKLIGINFSDNKQYNNPIFTKMDFHPIATFKLKDIGNKSSLKYAFALFKVRKELDELKSIFHVHRVDSAFPLLYPIKISNSVVVTIHGSSTHWEYLGKSLFFRKFFHAIEYLVIKKADKIIMVSKKGLKEYHTLYPQFKEKIIYISNGVDIKKFYPMKNKIRIRKEYEIPINAKVILYAGRFVKEKGVDLLLKSYKIIESLREDVFFIFVGGGPLKDEIKKYGNNGHNIKLLPPVPNEEMPKIYNIADVLVMASYFEGWSMTMGEALACEIPVVTTNVGDAEEIIDNGKNGYVVNSREPQEFAEKCILALNKSYEMKTYARESITPYSLEGMANKITKVYKEVLR